MTEKKLCNVKITAVSKYLPERKVTNLDLEKMIDTSDQWIRTRTGIGERRVIEKGQACSDLSIPVAQQLLKSRGLPPEAIDLIIIATVTPDMFFPATACIVQDKIGAKNAWGYDLSGACSGFLYALVAGAQFIQTGAHKKVMVIGADVMTSIINFEDRATCVLFGDGAGGVLLEPAAEDEVGLFDFILKSDGAGGQYLSMPAGGSRHPATIETVNKKMHYVHQDGRQVFKFATRGMAEVSEEILRRNNLSAQDLDLYVPHQANLRIIDGAVERLGLDRSKVAVNIDKYANTTAATIPICLAEAQEMGQLKKGDLVLLASFGAGFTWGSILLRWTI